MTFTRPLTAGLNANEDVILNCKPNGEYQQYNWFTRKENADYWFFENSGTYWMRLLKDGDNCMVSLSLTKPAVEESAFKVMASLTAFTAAAVVATL